jgi:hypothetical protein
MTEFRFENGLCRKSDIDKIEKKGDAISQEKAIFMFIADIG